MKQAPHPDFSNERTKCKNKSAPSDVDVVVSIIVQYVLDVSNVAGNFKLVEHPWEAQRNKRCYYLCAPT